MSKGELLEAVMDTVLDGLIVIDKRGIIQRFNTAACTIFGYEVEDVLLKNVKILMPEPYQSSHDAYLHHYQQTGERKIIGIGREILAQRKDGSIFPMELGVNEMEMDGQAWYVGTIRDISERKASEQAIHDTLNKLKISNQELDQFAYIASHDLKEPLRGLANNALFLREDFEAQLDESGVKRLDRIDFLCKRMEQLIDKLLYYSRLGRQELAITRTDLNKTISKVIELSFADDTGASAKFVFPELLPTVVCDHQKVAELFRNLISNGIKYNSKPQKCIEIGVTQKQNPFTREHEQQVFYVRDNGNGIASRYFDDIFRIFKRLNEEDDNTRGSGVGLTFVKKIIERHNGHIWLESELQQGTSFFFTLHLES